MHTILLMTVIYLLSNGLLGTHVIVHEADSRPVAEQLAECNTAAKEISAQLVDKDVPNDEGGHDRIVDAQATCATFSPGVHT